MRKRALGAIDQRRDALIALSLAIHRTPELGYQEREASLRLTEFLEGDGFKVARGYRGVETAYRGDAKGKTEGARVSRSSPNTTRSPTSGTAAGTTSSR